MPTVVVERRPDDYMAYLQGHKTIWGCGKSISEAIGDVIQSHPESFGVKTEFDRESIDRWKHIPIVK
jgi:hypothetical protein